MALPRVSFGGSNVAAPNLSGSFQAMQNVQNQIRNYQQDKQKAEQLAVVNAFRDKAEARAVSAEDRAIDELAFRREKEAADIAHQDSS